jgi:AAA domain
MYQTIPAATTKPSVANQRGYPDGWRPSSLKDVLSRTPEPPPWVIEGLLPLQSGLLCSGQPHAAKSLNWLAAALESVVSHKVWGKFDCPKVKRVLFIETEDPRWLVEHRIHGLSKGLGIKQGDDLEKIGFFFSCTGPFKLLECEIQLRALIEEVQPDWVVLSTLQGLIAGSDWSQQKDMGPVNAIMVGLQRLVPLVAITHSPRDGNARRSAGSITQDANYLVTMHFKKDDKDGKTVVSVVGDSKMGVELDFDLTLVTETVKGQHDNPVTEVRRITHSVHKENKAELILAYRKANPEAGPDEIADAIQCSVQWVRKVLKIKEPGLAPPPDFFEGRPTKQ